MDVRRVFSRLGAVGAPAAVHTGVKDALARCVLCALPRRSTVTPSAISSLLYDVASGTGHILATHGVQTGVSVKLDSTVYVNSLTATFSAVAK